MSHQERPGPTDPFRQALLEGESLADALAAKAGLADHLRDCRNCQHLLKVLAKLDELAAAWRDAIPPPPPDLLQRVLRHTRGEPPQST